METEGSPLVPPPDGFPLPLDQVSRAARPGSQRMTRGRAAWINLFVVFLWATSWVFIKIGLEELPALTFAGLRYTIAFLCLVPFAVAAQRKASPRRLPGQAVGRLIALGLLLYTVTQGAMFLALEMLPAVTVNLLWSFSTIAVAGLSAIWLAERPSRFQWLGVVLAALGAVIYFSPAGTTEIRLVGIVVGLVGVLGNATAAILGRGINRDGRIHPIVVTAVSMGAGSLALLVIGASAQGLPSISSSGWAIILWLAVVNTAVAFTLWNLTLQTLSATESSILNGTMLIWIPLLAVIFLGETITSMDLAGLILAAIGTLIVQLRSPAALTRLARRGPG